ncbi:Fe-S cluster assembly protein HesB [Roseomonas sp. SSH11]|uniref:Fe-S cluster assembly protein HesB n=1 Tax=Pararoseomonas baculiformis TaxID=2820812 RepID=A0ABS4AHL2_9PROT|nr:Fe-S cluster assembly protein HesB [Pararoseomonas baculiformis]
MLAPDPTALSPQSRLLEAHRRLCEAYGCPIAYFHALEPLDELVSSLLSHRTRNADSARAFRQLRDGFPGWEAVRDAPVEAVQDAIAPCTWPEAKAPALQRILQLITARRGALDLDHLADMPVQQAREWLESLPGVGPKTSAAVLSFSMLRARALPVDSHHHRVAQRLGIIPGNLPVGPSHRVMEAMLPPEWDAQQVYDHHEVLMLHGQRVCHFRSPACGRCVVLDLCPTGQARMRPSRDGVTTPIDRQPNPA